VERCPGSVDTVCKRWGMMPPKLSRSSSGVPCTLAAWQCYMHFNERPGPPGTMGVSARTLDSIAVVDTSC